MPSFDDLEEEAFRKHCRKNREMMVSLEYYPLSKMISTLKDMFECFA